MNKFIRQQLGKVHQGRKHLNRVKPWPLILIAIVAWSYVVTRWVHDTEFLAGFWGITNDEIAVVTIEKDGGEETSTETIIIQDPSKSFWDGLQLLGVPLVLAVLGAWFQKTQQEQAERTAKEQQAQAERTAKEQREQDADETREEVLQLYFDRISTLLIDKNLMAIASKGDDASPDSKELLAASLDVIRARTLSILRRFEKDIDRKSSVVRFLAEAEIISDLKLDLSRANLAGANLAGANLAGANLTDANLAGANLTDANLRGAHLTGVDLFGAHLNKANLTGAKVTEAKVDGIDLTGANLTEAYFNKTNISLSNLTEADLSGAKFIKADLVGTNLSGAKFQRAKLVEANLSGAKFIKADLGWANLSGANLKQANFSGADLSGTNIHRTYLNGACLSDPNEFGTNLDEASLEDISFNEETTWPTKEEVAKAKNVPIELQRQLGLIPEPPQKSPTDQQPPTLPQ